MSASQLENEYYAVMGVIRALQRRSEMPEIHRAECSREAELLTHIICGAGAYQERQKLRELGRAKRRKLISGNGRADAGRGILRKVLCFERGRPTFYQLQKPVRNGRALAQVTYGQSYPDICDGPD